MLDYNKNNYKIFQLEYYKYYYNKIINGIYKYKLLNIQLIKLFEENWNNIKFENIINFTHSLHRIKYYEQSVELYQNLIMEKFDNKDNIIKLINYIFTNFININEEVKEFSDENKIFNFRFIIDNLKANGYLLFEEYFIQIKERYNQQLTINLIVNDKKLINYFMKIISIKKSTSVNRKVNEYLIKIRDYIYDLEDSYNNNKSYQKIKLEKESKKYIDMDISKLKRENYNFTILKYNFADKLVKDYTLNDKIEPYFDIYKSYYKSRYPDRAIDFDIISSNLIIKMKFDKHYYIHMALIQYIVLDKIMNKSIKNNKELSGINIFDITSETLIPISDLQNTINSLLKIKLIARTNNSTPENIKFLLNNDFNYTNNKISIASLVIENNNDNNKPKEFLHDRSIIVLCNIVDHIKKNKYFYYDTIVDAIKYKIPFNITDELLNNAITEALNKDLIKKNIISNDDNDTVIYEYIE
jgi:hypothetical protein